MNSFALLNDKGYSRFGSIFRDAFIPITQIQSQTVTLDWPAIPPSTQQKFLQGFLPQNEIAPFAEALRSGKRVIKMSRTWLGLPFQASEDAWIV